MDCTAYRELVAADVDGLLDALQDAEATAHVATCARCAALRRAEQTAKALLRERALHWELPAPVRQRMIAALERESGLAADSSARRGRRLRRAAALGAVAAAAAVALVWTWRSRAPDLLAVLVNDVRAASTPEMALAVRTNDLETLLQYYRSAGRIDFDRTVPDLAAMGFHPVGGSVVKIGAADSTLAVFEGPLGRVVCRRFRAGALELPAGGERIGEATVFTVQGITVRFQRDGDVICCLASAMPREQFIRYFVAPHGY
jgi:anti-sigma factor RsiW